MSLIGKIKTLFEDKAKTTPVFPRTKVKAVSDDNGIGLDALLEGIQADITANETAVSNAQASADSAQASADNAQTTANTVKTTANNAMPKSGGTFTGQTFAYSTNRAARDLRNIAVRNSNNAGANTNSILMVRK